MSADRRRFRRIALSAAAGVAVVGLVFSLWWRGSDGTTRVAENARSIAVLPFVNTGGSADDEYFSDGLTDELAHALARIPGLRLTGRTSTYAFKGRTASAQEIGRTLGVGAFVTGSVRRAGDRIRVTTQLVSTADGKVLRDAVSESRTGDMFAVQDELTRTIVSSLAPALGDSRSGSPADAARGTTNQAAYDAYLRGRYYWTERGAENVARAIEYMREAVALDPGFARAHAGLALAYAVLNVYVPGSSDTTMALTAASAQQAIALDSTLADAQLAMGIALEDQSRHREALARYERALALEPWNVSAHHVLGLALLSLGRTDEAIAALRRSAELDPLAKSPGSTYGAALLAARRFPEAIAVSRRVLALDSTFTLALATLGLAQAFADQPDSAVRTLERAVTLHPNTPQRRSALVFAYAAADRWRDAERERDALRGLKRTSEAMVSDAVAALVFGDREPLVRLLSTREGRMRWLLTEGYLGCNPLLDPLWPDARFRAAMREHGVEFCRLARPWPIGPRPA